MSIEEKDLPEDKGPHKLSKSELDQVFSADFVVESIKDTVYHGTLNPLPKALFGRWSPSARTIPTSTSRIKANIKRSTI